MGNTLGSKRSAKVMKINGEELKLRTPIQAREVVKDYPGHVILDSEAVKHYGTRAKPLEPAQELKPRRLYFLVQLPEREPPRAARRVRSHINMSAKDRLESLMLARRSASDLSIMNPSAAPAPEIGDGGGVRVKMRLPRSEVERLLKESRDEAEAAQKIVDLCLVNNNNNNNNNSNNNDDDDNFDDNQSLSSISEDRHLQQQHHAKRTRKRVSFRPINEGEIQIAVA